jgi:3-dehydroquinate synthase
VLVTEDVVGPLWADAVVAALSGFVVDRVVLPSGEANKGVETWYCCVDAILRLGVDRKTPILALGGGVLGDLVGFAAATVLRGVPFVQLPTTLLAMVDSSVGGKTGMNHDVGKNLIGAFYQPVLVYAALPTLDTLPVAERRAGLGEVVKTALLDPDATARIVGACVAIKAAIVAADEREAGQRAWLNAGHTVGHGLETAAGYGVLRHGDAVGLGLVLETEWAVRAGLCADAALPERLRGLLLRLGLPSEVPSLDRRVVVDAMRADKKTDGASIKIPVPARVGQMTLVDVPVAHLDALLGASLGPG